MGSGAAAALLIAALALGGAFAAEAQIRFDEVSVAAGINQRGETYGASWGDLNGDGYPDLFVSNHRSRPALFLNTGTGRFIDVATQTFSWINRPNADTHGGSWFDFDNDGDQDLLVSMGQGNPSQFLVNERGALVNRTNELGVAFTTWGGRLPIWMDYDGDGLPDFVMTQMAGIARLMRQRSGGGFEDVTSTVNMVCRPAQYALMLDVSGDGRLDLACPDRDVFPWRVYDTLPVPWRNITGQMAAAATVVDSIVADFNNDGRQDIFHIGGAQLRPSGAVLSGGSRIEALLMGGEKGFSFVTGGRVTFDMDWNRLDSGFGLNLIRIGASGTRPQGTPFTLDPANPNVAGMPADTGETPLLRIGYNPTTQRWTLILRTVSIDNETVWSDSYFMITSTAPVSGLQNIGLWAGDGPARPTLLMNFPGGFEDRTVEAGLGATVQCVSAAAGDFDNDMHIDLYLACRGPASNLENILLRNRGDGTFERIAGAGGAAGPVGSAIGDGAGTADSVVIADYDVDGFLDLFVTNGFNMRPVRQGGPHQLYRNRGNSNRWIQLDLVGTRSHREAVGTRVTARASGVTQTRVKNGSYHRWSHDHTRMHFGLANANSVDLTIHWPSGTVDTHLGVPANRVYRATESGGIAPVVLGEALPYPCGLPPDLNASTDRGVFIAKNCATGNWLFRVASGGSPTALVYSGQVSSDQPMTNIIPRGAFQPADSLQTSDGGRRIDFEFHVRLAAMRGADFLPAEGAGTCLTVNLPPGTQIFAGPLRKPVGNQFDLETMGPCEGGPPPPPPPPPPPDISACGMPAYDPGVTASTFLWQNCATGEWLSRVSAGGSSTRVTYAGAVTATAPFTGVRPIALEADDVLDFQSDPAAINFILNVAASNQDGFGFTLAPGANACFGVASPGSSVIVGAAGTAVASPFRLDTFEPCASQPPPPPPPISTCGMPAYAPGATAGVFAWQNCHSGQWQMRVTAGGSAGQITYVGNIVATAPWQEVKPISIEADDVLDVTGTRISFALNVFASNQDGFSFLLPSTATGCFSIDLPANAPVRIGPEATPVATPFRLDTLAACTP